MTCLYCHQPVLAKGMCSKHYNRWRRHGDPTRNRQGMRTDLSVEFQPDGFWAQVDRTMKERLTV